MATASPHQKGSGRIMLDRNRTARKRLDLKKHEHILGDFQMGYSDVKFRNKIEGKKLPVQWIKRYVNRYV